MYILLCCDNHRNYNGKIDKYFSIKFCNMVGHVFFLIDRKRKIRFLGGSCTSFSNDNNFFSA